MRPVDFVEVLLLGFAAPLEEGVERVAVRRLGLLATTDGLQLVVCVGVVETKTRPVDFIKITLVETES